MSQLVPVIDFSGYNSPDASVRKVVADQIKSAMAEVGFMSLSHLPIDRELIDSTFQMAADFFAATESDKAKSAYGTAEENFGYQGYGKESLDPGANADHKETFTLRNAPRQDPNDSRWPSADFRARINEFYRQSLNAAHDIQRLIAESLDVETEFFVDCHTGENATLRLLHYPEVETEQTNLGAGQHTDYGMLTLLFQRDVAGLEVQTAAGDWQLIAPDPFSVVINTGDLMERWTNGRFRSTPHRVRQIVGNPERFSIALFVDPDSATPIEVLPSCLAPGETSRFPRISAGEYVTARIAASHAGK